MSEHDEPSGEWQTPKLEPGWTSPPPKEWGPAWFYGESKAPLMPEEAALDFYHRMVMAGCKVDTVEDIPDRGVDFLGHLSKTPDGSPEVTFAVLTPHPLPFAGRPRGAWVQVSLGRREITWSTDEGFSTLKARLSLRFGATISFRRRT